MEVPDSQEKGEIYGVKAPSQKMHYDLPGAAPISDFASYLNGFDHLLRLV